MKDTLVIILMVEWLFCHTQVQPAASRRRKKKIDGMYEN